MSFGRPSPENPGAGIRSGGVRKVPEGGSWLQAHLPLVAALGVLLLAAVGGGAFVLLSSSSDSGSTGQGPVAGTRRTGTRSPGTTSPGASSGAASSTTSISGRNPFARIEGVASTTEAPSGSPSDPDVAQPTTAPTVTATTSVTATRTATSTITTTNTTTSSTRYLSLHGWTADGRPQFWVNEQAYTPSAGETFAGDVTYTGKSVTGGVTYAEVTYGTSQLSVADGQVILLP